MSVKINKLEIENIKRVKAVKIEPTQNGLTIVGGDNNQGKTSVLDAIAWALGGNKYKPSQAQRIGSIVPPRLNIVMSNGLIIERSGKNSVLKVSDPSGQKAGQGLLDSFVEELAINLPKFMEQSNKEKARTLLKIIGVGDELYELERQEQSLYNQRYEIGRIADQKAKYAEEMPYFENVPADLVSIADLIQAQQKILAINGENQRKRQQAEQLSFEENNLRNQIEQLQQRLSELEEQHQKVINDLMIAQTDAKDLVDESTLEIEQSIANIEETNRKIRINLDKEKAESDAEEFKNQYKNLTEQIEEIRNSKLKLLNNADLPLPELSVQDSELIYKGQKWDNMSGSDQLKVATAIVRKLKPECGFVLIDKLEQMDMKSLNEFGEWLKQEGLQAIATRVSQGDECSIIIEDGYVKEANQLIQPKQNTWQGKGAF